MRLMQDIAEGVTVREYAKQKQITMQATYRRIWEGRLKAKQFLGRWIIYRESTEPDEELLALKD
jgi:hypothetical protein